MAKKHLNYFINNKKVPSVTTVLDVLSKPGLEKWYGRLGTAKAEQERDTAADFGSSVHSGIEAIFQGQIPEIEDERLNKVLENFQKWADYNISEFVCFEKAIYHDDLGYAGTTDIFAKLKNGKLILADIKTSKKVRDTHYLQVAAYYYAQRIEDDAIDFKDLSGAMIIHLDHASLTWEAVNATPTPETFNLFKSCLDLYKWRNG